MFTCVCSTSSLLKQSQKNTQSSAQNQRQDDGKSRLTAIVLLLYATELGSQLMSLGIASLNQHCEDFVLVLLNRNLFLDTINAIVFFKEFLSVLTKDLLDLYVISCD